VSKLAAKSWAEREAWSGRSMALSALESVNDTSTSGGESGN
jgi:hypothetical protein